MFTLDFGKSASWRCENEAFVRDVFKALQVELLCKWLFFAVTLLCSDSSCSLQSSFLFFAVICLCSHCSLQLLFFAALRSFVTVLCSDCCLPVRWKYRLLNFLWWDQRCMSQSGLHKSTSTVFGVLKHTEAKFKNISKMTKSFGLQAKKATKPVRPQRHWHHQHPRSFLIQVNGSCYGAYMSLVSYRFQDWE